MMNLPKIALGAWSWGSGTVGGDQVFGNHLEAKDLQPIFDAANVGFTVSEAKTVHAPIINEMLISLECQLVHKATIGSHMHLTGEIKRIIADDSVLDENDKVVLEKLRPLIYDEEQFRYLGLGEKLSDAFKPGVAMKKELGGNNAG